MNKRSLILIGLLLVGGGLTWLIVRWHNGREEYEADYSEQDLAKAIARVHPNAPTQPVVLPQPLLDPSHRVRLAIGWLGLQDETRNGQVADLLTAELTGAKGLELVDRQSLGTVLRELELNLSGLVRAKDAIRVGKLVRADWFMLGTGTSIAGTNSIVVRVVDARTGILRDSGIFVSSQPPTGLASDIATFIRQCRKSASSGKHPVYLAIGTFRDLSINSRQAGFPSQLRGYLTAAYQAGPVTLLEREYVETLLQEVRLDLAGLSEESSPQPPAPMQSAFWMVTGSYQSYETTNLQVEVDLEVARMFGTTKHVSLRGRASGSLNQEIKRAIDQVISQNTAAIIPTRQNEVRLQMANGKELVGIGRTIGGLDLIYLGLGINAVLDGQKAARERRNAEEALRAFQTVLLLEPTNREAKLCLAACLRNNTIQRVEEARHYYREVIESPEQDKWSDLAKQALSASFDWRDAQGKALWFSSATASTTYSNAAEYYRGEAKAARAEVLVKGTGPEAQALAETRLWRCLTNALLGTVAGPTGVEEYVRAFGTNQAAAAQRLADLYPRLRSQGPHLAAYLLAAVVTAQVETNAQVVAEFQHVLEQLVQHPDQVFRPYDFWWHIQPRVWDWSWEHKDYGLAATLLEGKLAAAALYTKAASQTNWVPTIEINDRDRICLGFAYLGTQAWEKARRIFESLSNQPFSIFEDGPWGTGGTVIFAGREAEYCRQKLGLPITHKGPEFRIGKPVMQLCNDQILTTDEEGLWIGLDSHLLHLGFDLKTNLVVNLPIGNPSPITAICATSTNIWIGTDGGGLYDFDRASHQFRYLREKDGLLMDKIASLYISREALWIGYGRRVPEIELKSEGGLGKIDLRTRQSTSFVPSVLEGPLASGGPGWSTPAGTPTRNSVLAIAEGAPSEIWFLAEGQTPLLCRYRTAENAWDVAVNQACSCLLRDPKYLFVGRNWNYFGENKTESLGVSLLDLSAKNAAWQELKRPDGLPPGRVTALALDSGRLWVGGFGYIALVDPAKDEVRAVAFVQTESVDRLQTGGGYIWAQFNCHLYRIALSDVYSHWGSN
jgi:hypothetical protein